MKVIITVSTGMIGKGCLLECIDRPEIDSILVANRNPTDIRHPKLKGLLITYINEICK